MNLNISQRTRTRIAFVSGALLIVALVLTFVGRGGTEGAYIARDWTLIVASVLAGFPILLRAIQALIMRAFSIDLLVSIAVIGALIIGEYVESAVVSFLFLFGAWLEARSLERTRASLRELIDLAPTQATVLRDGERLTVDADDVEEGDTVIVTNGERIAVDGTVTGGSAEVSEASITGEPVPVSKTVGNQVFAGTIAESGFLEISADRVGDETTFARIIELVEEAQDSKTRRQRFLDRFAQIYTPAIVVLAVAAFIWSRDLGFALTFLVIACPGALVISVPVAAVAGLGNIAKHGVLVKDGESLENLASANMLVVDKTGTLTVGRPVVTEIVPTSSSSGTSLSGISLSDTELLQLAATVEAASEHHAARAIVAEAASRGVALIDGLSNIEVVTGVGVTGSVEGRHIIVGRRSLLQERGVVIADDVLQSATAREQDGTTVVYISVDGVFAGLIGVADEVRAEAAAALSTLRARGIKRVIMLTGDNPHIAQKVADELGIDEVRASLMPADKAEIVREMQASGARIAMVGDGVNDAAALATADVGIAMGTAGTDVSVETADVVLLTDRLDQLAHAHRVAQATVRIMMQNTALALITVVILIAAVLMHLIALAGGMLVHEISVLLVILNALRLSYIRGPGRVVSRTKHKDEIPIPAG